MATFNHYFHLYFISLFVLSHSSENPVIGILSQEAFLVNNAYPDAHSFITASYVKWLESSGARVIPVWIGQDDAYYERVVNYTNGVLFPGGGTYFNTTDGYGEAAKVIYKLAVKANDDADGVHYPLMGVCLGMEVFGFAATDGEDIRTPCAAKNIALPLEFDKDFKKSRIFGNITPGLEQNLKTENLTYNYHQYCLLESVFKDSLKDWVILARNKDINGLEFVSAMENTKYPFYGIQFHPEKNAFEFKKKEVPHGRDAVEMAQYFSNFFVEECRGNNHTFPSEEILRDSLFYNYDPVYSIANTSYEQLYLFHKEDYPKNQLTPGSSANSDG